MIPVALRKWVPRFQKEESLKPHAFSGKNFEVNGWGVSELIVRRVLPISSVHPFPLDELQLMGAAVYAHQPDVIFDWGTHIGKSARIFFELTRGMGLATEIHSIDLPPDVEHIENPGHSRGLLVKNLEGVELHLGDGVSVALDLLKSKGPFQRPLFFVDGDHSYQTVLRELELILEASSDSAILLHDTFTQTSESGYNVGPSSAIETLLPKLQGRSIIHTKLSLPGMTWIGPKKGVF